MSKLLDYYEEELNHLVEAGREFAALHPDRAQYLTPDDPRARDPHVERLLEAFSFLAARIRLRLDDDYPELTHALLSLVWPHYLRPIPSMATVEFQPKEGMLKEATRIERGALIDSDPVEGGRGCRFRTCYDTVLLPIAVDRVEVQETATGEGRITIRFRSHEGADLGAVKGRTIRLHLAGETPVTYELCRLLTSSVKTIEVAFTDAAGERRERRLEARDAIRPVGLAKGESVLPADERSFPGFRLLQEYFLFREKFLFLDIPLGESLAGAEGAKAFELSIGFDEPAPKGLRISEANLRLHCAPIINLFEKDAEPIRLDRRSGEYRVVPEFARPADYEVYEITSVEAVARDSRRRVLYRPLHAFHHLGGAAGGERRPFYVTKTRASQVRRGFETYVAFPTIAGEPEPEEETVSLRLVCTNGVLPDLLRIGQVRHPVAGVPEFVRVRNVSQPTRPIWPSLDGGTDWKFIAHLSLNLVSLRDLDAFKGVLALYGELGDRTTIEANRRRIEGVREIRMAPAETMLRGSVIRGTDVLVEAQEDHFADRGDLRLFTAALAEFLALYASINSFVRLTVACQPSGTRLSCPPKFSTRIHL